MQKLDRDKILALLKPYFQRGLTIHKACEKSGIVDDETIHRWIDEDINIAKEIKVWQNTPTMAALDMVTGALMDSKNKNFTKRERMRLAKWWLSRKERDDFSTRVENDNTNVNLGIDDIMKEFEDPDNLPSKDNEKTD